MCPICFIGQSQELQKTEVKSILDVPYVLEGGHKQQLDLYLPGEQGFPTLLLIHGGSLSRGDREPYGEICKTFASKGIACAAMSYRLFPGVDWPAPVEDVAAAYGWLRTNISKYGGRAEQLFILGHSAACTLATLVAGDQRYLAAHGLSTQDISGVVAMGCRLNYDATTRFEDADPERIETYFREHRWGARFGSLEALANFRPMVHVGPHLPPILILIAETERFQPPILEDATAYIGAAREAGVDVDLAILPDRTHYSSMRLLVSADDPTFKLIVDFIEEHSSAKVKH